MHELPGDVFVTSQLLSAQMEALAEQGIMGFINNRPDMEAPVQPLSEDLETAMQNISIDYHHIPMSGGLTPGLIEASITAYSNMPRPIVAFCASGMRSAALWAFAHVKDLGAESVIKALEDSPYTLNQIYPMITDYAEKLAGDLD